VIALLGVPAERERRGALARAAVEANRGAVARLFALVEPLALPATAAPNSRNENASG